MNNSSTYRRIKIGSPPRKHQQSDYKSASTTSLRRLPVVASPAVLDRKPLDIAHTTAPSHTKRRFNVSDFIDRSAKWFRPDERKRSSEVSGRPTSRTGRPTSKIDRSSSKTDRSSSKTDHSSGKTDRQTSKTGRSTSRTNCSTSKTNHSTSKTGRPTSKTDRRTSKTNRSTSKTGRPTSRTDRQTSKTGRPISRTDRSTSKTGHPTSRTDRRTSKTGRPTSRTDRSTSKTNRSTSKTGRPRSKTGRSTSKTYRTTSRTDRQTSKTSRPTSRTDRSTSKTYRPTSRTDCQTSKTGRPTSKTDRPRHSVVAAPRPSAAPGVSKSPRDWPVVAQKLSAAGVDGSSVTSSCASPVNVSPASLFGHWLETTRATVTQQAKRHLDASEVTDRSAKRSRPDEQKRSSEVSGRPTSKSSRSRHADVTAPRPSATPGVSRSPQALSVVDRTSSVVRERPLPSIRPVDFGECFETTSGIIALEEKRRSDASGDTDQSAKRHQPDDRKPASDVTSGATLTIGRPSDAVVTTPRQPAVPIPNQSAVTVTATVTTPRQKTVDVPRHQPIIASRQSDMRTDATTPIRSVVPVSGQSTVTVAATVTTPRQKIVDVPRHQSVTTPRQSDMRRDSTTPIRSVVPVPGQSTVTVTATVITPRQKTVDVPRQKMVDAPRKQPVATPRHVPVATPRQQSVNGPLPLSEMSLLLRRNNTGVLGRDRGDEDDGLPAYSSEGMSYGGELQLPADPSTLPLPSSSPPLPPPRPQVGVIARGPTMARVVWEAGSPVMRADGTPVETAPVQRYEIYVCRDRAMADPASPWLMMAHAEPPPADATDDSDDLMYRDISGLPTDEQLYFVVVPVDIYGRESSDFDVAGVILKA